MAKKRFNKIRTIIIEYYLSILVYYIHMYMHTYNIYEGTNTYINQILTEYVHMYIPTLPINLSIYKDNFNEICNENKLKNVHYFIYRH